MVKYLLRTSKVDVVHDSCGGDESQFRRFAEAAGICHQKKGIQLWIVHENRPPFWKMNLYASSKNLIKFFCLMAGDSIIMESWGSCNGIFLFLEGSFFVRLFFAADLYGADQYEYGTDELDNG